MCQLYFGFECAIKEALMQSDVLGPLMVVAMAGGVVVPPLIAGLAAAYNIARGGSL